MKNKTIICLMIMLLPGSSYAIRGMTDNEVRKNIIDGFTSSFKGDCACPENKDSKGNRCGDSSAYFKSNSDNSVKCYPADVTEDEVQDYRDQYNIPVL